MSIIVNANMFRIASAFVSKEETRYYLNGVFIERHQLKGVVLTVTDGHRLICIHDENGSSDLDGVIVKLDKNALSMCKADKREMCDRRLKIEGDGEVTILAHDGDGVAVSSFRNCFIDGTFPDYRRVVPSETDNSPASFNGKYLADFGQAAADLSGNKNACFRILQNGGSPALIRFATVEHAFGVLVPIRDNDETGTPWFFNAAPAPVETPQESEVA